jgi:putative hydrolase of the HAD superfamily
LCFDVTSSWFKSRFPSPEAEEIKKNTFYDSDIGKISEKELFNRLSNIVNIAPSDIEKEIYNSVILNKELIQLIIELKKKYKIGLCSNAISSYIRRILKENDMENIFDSIIISSEVGIVKPDPEIYAKSLESLGMNAKEVVFIDDTLANVEEAKKLGMRSFVFKSNTELKTELLQFVP